MKKMLIPVITVICLLCFTLSGCKKEAEKPADSPEKTEDRQSAKPSEKTSEKPSESPDPIVDVGELALNDYYYEEGDPDGMYLYFYDDGSVEVGDPYDDTIFADYKIRGDEITLTYEGETETLFVVDEFTLVDESRGGQFIREGGVSYTGDLPDIFFSEYYYLDGDSGDIGLYFWDDGDVDIDGPENSITGTYRYDGDIISITVDGSVEMELEISDICTLIDSFGDIYCIEDSGEMILETYDYYYLDGDEYAGSLYFYDDGDVDAENSEGEMLTATYTLSGTTITITSEDGDLDLEIINAYILESDDGTQFIRFP